MKGGKTQGGSWKISGAEILHLTGIYHKSKYLKKIPEPEPVIKNYNPVRLGLLI